MTVPTILISGAGIAGPSLALWLTKNGYRVIVVEIAPGIRPGGQTVDLRGAGGDVVERMGLMPQMREHALEQHGVAWVRSDGSRRAEMPVTAFDGNGLVSKLEILRGDLVDVLYQATKDTVEYRFNTRISALNQDDDGVDVTLADGTQLRADLVVGADGPHSAVRGWRSGPKNNSSSRSADTTHGSAHPTTSAWTAGTSCTWRPAASTHPCGRRTIPQWPRRDWLLPQSRSPTTAATSTSSGKILVDRFAGAGWQCDALLTAAQEADDFYFDSFLQVHMPAWTSGRVALVGDAGYCASPLSGMGTSLALVGAYLLAGELGPADSL